jgi:hypothetical protein
MTSERTQRQIDRLLDEAERAMAARDWTLLRQHAEDVLLLDADNGDAKNFFAAAERAMNATGSNPPSPEKSRQTPALEGPATPSSFASGRYMVKKVLGEGGKKKVYLAHDTLLDRDVAFALIKTEGLDDVGRDRIAREAKAMGSLGAHPHIVSVFDLGEEGGQPYIVTELMGGGDVEGLIDKAPDHRPTLDRTLEIGVEVCRGLEFAHSHGIVHRDLKPGNVWLTESGTAKLGDFGLAVAIDKTRLTQAGMMVGTVSYMPPEQATGGEVTPCCDLYSLGAMLYEMMTGRPPFVGDDSVAIITQHLNVAPVSPSWHNPAIPAVLETLILRLLEKDPAKRPASAREVRQVLEAVARPASGASGRAEPGPTPPVANGGPVANPMYRSAFVGREVELRQLQSAYDAALSGSGAMAMVVGEPGIGKTSLCDQLATYATIRGGKALIGHCYEEGSHSLPYLPFVEAMRSYVLAREPNGLESDLGSGAVEVARIVSEIRDRVPVELRPAGEPEEERWRLLQAVASFLRNASSVQPLLLILEDLHDADRGTLDLLLHLSRSLAGSRLLVVGTYRDVEVDRAHPLSSALAELRRGANFLRVPLRGLTAEEVQRMMTAVAQRDIPWPFAELVHRQTEGNPLFVQEMLRYLVEEGLVAEQGSALRRVGGESLAGRIPEGLRDVIGKRLSRLSERTNEVLSVASVIGREFRLDVLQGVAGLEETELEAALADAMAIAVVEERGTLGATATYRFTHAFFRQTLYEETIAPRRIRLHQQVARTLEEVFAQRLQEHAAELAEHFAYSSDADALAKAVIYGELAASRASEVSAYGEAVRHLDQALKVQDVLDPADKTKRCDLLLALGDALPRAGEPLRAAQAVAPEALSLADQLGDPIRASHACQVAIMGLRVQSGGTEMGAAEFSRWLEEADRRSPPGSLDRVRTDLHIGQREYIGNRQRAGLEATRHALNLARDLGDDEALFASAGRISLRLPDFQEERLRIAEEFFDRPQGRASTITYGSFLGLTLHTFLAWGDRTRAEEALRRVAVLAERTGDSSLTLTSARDSLLMTVLDGRLEEALEGAQRLRERADELGMPGFMRQTSWNYTLRALCYLARADEGAALQPPGSRIAVVEGRSLVFAGDSALFLAHQGKFDEVRALLQRLLGSLRSGDASSDLSYAPLTNYLEAAMIAGDRDAVEAIRPKLEPVANLVNEMFPTVIARHLGAAAALLGDREAARAHYHRALAVAARVRFKYETAFSHLQMAELLLDVTQEKSGMANDRTAALEHLDFAVAEFRELKMQPSLERALRHKEVLKA